MPFDDDEDDDERAMGQLSEVDSADDLADATQNALEDLEDELGIKSIRTYQEAGVLTRDAGFVVRTRNGSEYQVTVVKSR